jgi:thiamine-phosphate pyrophosphorylase
MSTPSPEQRKSIKSDLRARLALHVLTDRDWSHGRETVMVARLAIAGGATVIQLRDKAASTRQLINEGRVLRELTREHDVLLIVNDRIDVALAIDADGAHVGQDDMPGTDARRLLGPDKILGISAGNLHEAEQAVADGADYLGVGPIYATSTKADAGPASGPELLRNIAARWSIPLVAIGGITTARTPEILRAGASGIAVITAVVSAENIMLAARELADTLKYTW